MNWLKQNWVKIILGMVLLIVLYFIPEKDRPLINSSKYYQDAACGELVASQKEEANLILQNNDFALKILEDKCLWMMGDTTRLDDFDGNGKKDEIAMITSGAGCGSCHGQEIRIIKNNEIIFYKTGIDFSIESAKEFVGFILGQQGDADENGVIVACCSSNGITEGYEFNKSTVTFDKIWTKRNE